MTLGQVRTWAPMHTPAARWWTPRSRSAWFRGCVSSTAPGGADVRTGRRVGNRGEVELPLVPAQALAADAAADVLGEQLPAYRPGANSPVCAGREKVIAGRIER